MSTIRIARREIGKGLPVFIVAELSANHCGSIDTAIATIRAMKSAGADAVKLQTYTPDTMTIDCDNEYFQINHGTLWDGRRLYDLYREAYTPWEWHPRLKQVADEIGLIFFSSPFDRTAVDFLETVDVPAYKIASPEITDIPLIEYIAAKGKPVILSTGVATLADIYEAVEACKRCGNEQIIILKCTTEYPTPLEDVNLSIIPNMAETFARPIGLSDHTLGISVPVAAVALGACMVEKHFILARELEATDAAFSLDPQEFGTMVAAIREVEKALGEVTYDLPEKSLKNREFCRSLFIVRDMKAGESFTTENVRSIRPGHGLPPKHLTDLLGQKARTDLKKGTPVRWGMIG
ncbi:MAG: pseudaminic acid synthase [Syntrophales bacterium]